MPYSIAVAGKGGTGKTTLSALVTTHLLRSGMTPVLAVDADPNANLHEVLGVECDRTVVDTVEGILSDGADTPAGVPRGRLVEYELHDAVVESRGFDLLVMGRTEGPGCYCHANDLLRGFLEKLVGSYPFVIIDNEAGMEHLSRRTARSVDLLLVVANPTMPALRSAGRIHEIVQSLKLSVGRSYLVVNRLNAVAGPDKDTPQVRDQIAVLDDAGLPLAGDVPNDEDVLRQSMAAQGILDMNGESAALASVASMMARLGVTPPT